MSRLFAWLFAAVSFSGLAAAPAGDEIEAIMAELNFKDPQ